MVYFVSATDKRGADAHEYKIILSHCNLHFSKSMLQPCLAVGSSVSTLFPKRKNHFIIDKIGCVFGSFFWSGLVLGQIKISSADTVACMHVSCCLWWNCVVFSMAIFPPLVSFSPFFIFRALLIWLITSMNQMFGTNSSLKHDIQQQPFSFFSVLELIDLCVAIALFGPGTFF